ncbi:hypothetical protein EV188_102845 [Actinomycetospora succinea]|uniref:Uncharacterized protein n=1 Tax=Actinomycetospora succinea TaxID=663603 RepID=A0A4R6VIJ0_9PSEU|nr:hypothetical protein [Actinomycetospora succinea]TDQ63188.1 hypothetical protein EV188_102845 [Actinomycetospora succinea]
MSRDRVIATLVGVTTKHWRRLLVWLHVVSSTAWMSGAAALAILLGLSRTDPALAGAAVGAARHLDVFLLAVAANASTTTGLVLAWTTSWGLVHHWWLVAKAAITLVQLVVGIAILSPVLDELAAGGTPAPASQVAGAAAMASAVAFQAWVSVAKPWPRTPVARRDRERGRSRLPQAGAPLVAAGVLAPVGDVALTVALGFPAPLLEVITLAVVGVARRRALDRTAAPTAGTTGPSAGAPAPAAGRRT